jgi:type 1 fimbriae regulatory protein FimB/type 1 fimbriae regulatory protein FimE
MEFIGGLPYSIGTPLNMHSDPRLHAFLSNIAPSRAGALGWGMPAAVGFSLGINRAPVVSNGCGYALANAGHDTRAIQDRLGHRSIQHTVRYTELAPTRFKDFWRD